MKIDWICRPFDELTPGQLYDALQLRSEVFVVEQNCAFLDADGKDPHCAHLLGYAGEKLAAYTRLVPPGLSYEEASIGRVVSAPFARRTGVGRLLMRESIYNVYRLYGKGPIRIGAQAYLRKFYESFGFVQCGESYLEDDIPHIPMIVKEEAIAS